LRTEILIIGGGLAGLALADTLQRARAEYRLVEARDRFGGRIKSARLGRATFDLGPSWFWPGQTRMAALARRFLIPVFEQHATGDLLFEEADGTVSRGAGSPMAGSLRLHGGMSALSDALAASLDPDRLRSGVAVTALRDDGARFTADLSDGTTIEAARVVLALPPRIAAGLVFDPTLPPGAMEALRRVPTWMAGQAKVVAVYGSAFWREAGLSGDAMSRRGPLVEIHDACDPAGGGVALFGFVGVPPDARAGRSDTLKAAAIAQLTRLFGPEAAEPRLVWLEDWAGASWTATSADRAPLTSHPAYGLPRDLDGLRDGRLIFASTETAPADGGFLEGALSSAERAAITLGVA